MTRRIVSFFFAAVFVMALVPAGVMAAKTPAKTHQGAKIGKQNRQELKQLKAQQKALRSEVKAAKANGKLSPEDRARFKAERSNLKSEIDALKGNAQKG